MLMAWGVVFSLGIYYVGKLPDMDLPTVARPVGYALDTQLQASGTDQTNDTRQTTTAVAPAAVTKSACRSGGRNIPGTVMAQKSVLPKVYAHLPVASSWANVILGSDCGAIDVLLADWYGLDLPYTEISLLTPNAGNISHVMANLRAGANAAEIMPILTVSYSEAPSGGADIQEDEATRARVADAAAKVVADNRYLGLCINPGSPSGDDIANFGKLFAEIDRRLAAAGRQTCLVVAAESPVWRDARILAAADHVVFLAFKEAWSETPPGPLAAQAWFEQVVAEAVAVIGADRLVVALGNFGYDWISGRLEPERIGYAEAMRRAARHNGKIEFSPDALNTNIKFVDDDGLHHEIWLLDAVSVFNQRTAVGKYDLGGVAVWSLGFEDPGIWLALEEDAATLADQLGTVVLEDYVGYEGSGAFMMILDTAEVGHRSLTSELGSGLIQQQAYTKIPQPYSSARFGAGADDMVVLTFDDGPDGAFTPDILDILHAEAVPASFFLIGSSILKWPGIVRRMAAEGHEIGSHTFFHPDITNTSDLRMRLELNAVQRLLISVTGRGSALFRSPYGSSEGPVTAAEARPFVLLDQSGYVVVLSDVVPPDWRGIGAEAIVADAMAQLKPSGGNVIVLHDGGGDRSATVAALPILINALRAKGYRFVSLATMLGVEREVLMPPEQGMSATMDAFTFTLVGTTGKILQVIFWVAVILGAARSFAVLGLALSRRHYPIEGTPYTPTVTAIIPAFNEEDVILESIESVLASDYPALELIVIDDGSRDRTHERIEAVYADDNRVSIIRQPNQGKWMALDTAYAHIRSEVVVAIDADTIILPDAIRKLVRAFRDPRVGAVAGKVQVGNRGRLLTKLQALEYITMQNIDRRAAEVFNGMMVVPGAIGAWRAEAVCKTGLYTNETLAEDADLTVSVLRAGYRVVFDEDAISVTEAPETVRDFMKQRLRWTLGMMQTAWKHRRAAREGRAVGLISIPDLWLFGVFLALLAPIADVVFLSIVLDTLIDAILGRPLFQSPVSAPILVGYLVLPAIDVTAALLAFRFERRAPTLVLLIPLQRFFYRPLQYITVYRSVWRAVTGKIAGWGKLARLGKLQLPSA
ncbi:MAG: glycosyltransferase [Pseudorhodobacter sp.]|nr:glycosyltransferase [Pseudorhodobacter sp.]